MQEKQKKKTKNTNNFFDKTNDIICVESIKIYSNIRRKEDLIYFMQDIDIDSFKMYKRKFILL